MERSYESPSSLETARCIKKHAYVYIDGRKPPEVSWTDIERGKVRVLRWREIPQNDRQCTPGQRSHALGKAVHDIGDKYFRRKTGIRWASLPGQIYAELMQWLPTLEECKVIRTEREIGDIAVKSRRKDGPTRALDLGFGLIAGKRDLLVRITRQAWKRLGLPLDWRALSKGWLLLDYKTKGNLDEFVKDAKAMRADVQANAYGLDVMDLLGIDAIPCRWVFAEAKEVRRSMPVDFILRRPKVVRRLALLEPVYRAIARVQDSASAPQNPACCNDYGGCEHHVDAGGPCTCRKPIQVSRRGRKSAKKGK